MAQNIYDDPAFFEGYSQLRRSIEGLVGAPEWPALQAQLPNLQGRRVIDLGCGYGWFCRYARMQGAAQVVGVDVSEKMLERARATTQDEGIAYVRADLDRFDSGEAAFDLVYSSLTLHYLDDLPGLLAKVHRALVPGGRLLFSVEHPIYTAPAHPGWSSDVDGRKTWPVNGYQSEGPRVTHWFAPGVRKVHRTLGTYLNSLIGAGFRIAHVEEWGPSDAQVAQTPALEEERERPMLLLVAAQRPAG